MAVTQSESPSLELPENVVVSRLDELASWCRKNSLWPMPFATACCGIELMATGAANTIYLGLVPKFSIQPSSMRPDDCCGTRRHEDAPSPSAHMATNA